MLRPLSSVQITKFWCGGPRGQVAFGAAQTAPAEDLPWTAKFARLLT